MGPFSASLKVPGDSSALAATLLVENGRLNIKAGDQSIGDWSLGEIELDSIDTGYRMSADGEQLLIEVKDRTGFQEAVEENTSPKIRKRPKIRQRIKNQKRPKAEKAPDVSAARVSSNGQTSTNDKPAPEAAASSGVMARVDGVMKKAEDRFGALLPSWVFGRATALVLVILLLLTFVWPTLVSSILLLGGLVTVVFGAVVYTDGHLAAKLLPGRSTPAHVLIVGVGILLFGVLIGVIAG